MQRHEPGTVQPPEVVDFTTDNLSQGLQSRRIFMSEGMNSPCCSVNYGWRVESYGIDLSMRTVSEEIDWTTANVAEFDKFARLMKVVDPSEIVLD